MFDIVANASMTVTFIIVAVTMIILIIKEERKK